MQKYIQQLLTDIAYATENVSLPFVEKERTLHDWISDEDENKTAPVRNLQHWTGINQEMLPPAGMLNDEQINKLLNALKKMLDNYNWCFVLQTTVSERIQYNTIRANFKQDAKIKQWHTGFFQLCKEGTEHGKCALGEHCECAFFAELFSGFIDEELTPEEERRRELEIEIQYIKRRYDNECLPDYLF